jgi:large subunit ribosomal protein L10
LLVAKEKRDHMNRDQKAAVVDELAEQIRDAQAVIAVDYRGISVPQVAALRANLRDADATFRIVKNSLTERAADKAETPTLRELLDGPTALTFIRGDAAAAAKAITTFQKEHDLLEIKGGLMDGADVSIDDIKAIAKLPSRDMLYAQLVNVVASPISGLARTLNQLVGGLAVALGQVRDQELVPAEGHEPATPAPAPVEEAPAEAEAPAEEAPEAEAEAPAEEAPEAEAEAPAEDPEPAPEPEPLPEPEAEAATDTDTTDEADASAAADDTAEAE